MNRVACLLALFTIAPMAAASDDPHSVVSRLYAALQASTPSEASIDPLLGDALRAAVEAQRTYEKACSALAAHDEKPHMLDQSPYLWAPDRPETASVSQPTPHGDAAWVRVDMAAGDTRWTDQVLLERQGMGWKIMDIRWGQEGRLTGRLKDFADFRCVASRE